MDIDIRPVPVDKLSTWKLPQLQDRQTRVEQLQCDMEAHVALLQEQLGKAEKDFAFIQKELVNVILATDLSKGDTVRVVCATCKGTGMKPSNVLSGQISKGSAFESTGKPATTPFIDEHNRCPDCQGQRWVIMERFKG